ncbi:F0F1 ATP synthase subunit gamma [Candidatus Erwinia haradaeae]|uniref:ATP synthase gamma chain n=1 Tax=Candidatus Erwinia haradaeae TaxID=1922217 RepID=A0A451D1I6_9GAMM|nr:F0F1 ATP synthase subunit gamma [Candidatus Erwinia haradaeae]VFP79475.1 ATP synthase gamma chain [Candidatus Erwinia haradaeae]
MSNEKGIRNKILCIQNTQKITKAMEMVSAAKLRKSHELATKSQPYLAAICQVINHMTLGNLEYKHQYFNVRNITRIGYLIISTNRGLCGSLNTHLFKKILQHMKTWSDKKISIDLSVIGSQGISYFQSIGGNIIAQAQNIGEKPSLSDIIGPIQVMLQEYDKKNLSTLYIASNKFINTISQSPYIFKILPILPEPHTIKPDQRNYWDYIYEPDPKKLLDTILKRYIESQVYQSVIENLACEQAARMMAMKLATDNSGDLITELQLECNKIRQGTITKELTEIVAGASAV